MRIHNLYADENGESHFRDIEIEWVEDKGYGQLSERVPTNGMIFRRTVGDYDLDWHPAPRRQYIVNLDAAVQITASDGEEGLHVATAASPDLVITDLQMPYMTVRISVEPSPHARRHAISRSSFSRPEGTRSPMTISPTATSRKWSASHSVLVS